MKKIVVLLLAVGSLLSFSLAQEIDSASVKNSGENDSFVSLKGKVDGLEESYSETKSNVDALKKIKVSGYIQAQYQVADVKNVLSLNGAKSGNVRQAFLIKRGRLKTVYDAGLAKYALELDVTQDGVGIKDAYAAFTEPWAKALSFTVGSMDRPFGYEVGYSSSMLESPERSRVIGNLFPKEKDLGAMLAFEMEDGPLSFLNVKGGVYNGGSNILNEYDDNKDVIGRLGFKWSSMELGLGIEGGASGYYGKVTNNDSTTSGGGNGKTYELSGTTWNATAGHKGLTYDRKYYGADLQLFYATPFIGGTCLKGEYIQGTHPTGTGNSGMSGAADFYGNVSNSAAYLAAGPLYNRKINGYYAYFIQNVDPIKSQLVVKYDMWDPNVEVKAGDFSSTTTTLTKNDLAISTVGFGWLCYVPWIANVRLMAFYEMPTYEKLDAAKIASGSLLPYTKTTSATNMNMMTLRVQVKF